MAKKNYITKEDQVVMLDLIALFLKESKEGTEPTKLSERIMHKLYYKYIDKIILGVINTYRFHRFYEVDDLKNIARMKVYEAILKQRFDPERGTIFTFLSTVIAKNLLSFTIRENKKIKFIDAFVELESIFTNEAPMYIEDFDKNMVIEYIFEEINDFFSDKPRFQKLADVFKIYFKNNIGKKFVKKDFIEFARSYTFSDSFCSSFFEACKKIKSVSKLLEDVVAESNKNENISGLLITSSKNNNRSCYSNNNENI